MVALAFVPPHMDCAMHICKASAATAKFGFQGVGVFLAGRWASKAATSSICSAASNIGYKSEELKSTMPSSSMHCSFNLGSECLVRQFAGFTVPATFPTFNNF